MQIRLTPKPTLQQFIETCTPLAIIGSLEQEFRNEVVRIAEEMLKFTSTDDPVENLARFLQTNSSFLGIVLALTNLSQEKFLRILSAERFATGDYGREWDINTIHRKLRREQNFAERIARLFIEGRNAPFLVGSVASFYLDQLALPENWNALIQDTHLIQNVIRHKLRGEYSDKKGDAVEAIIRSHLNTMQAKYGVSHTKGQVPLLRKEVDHILPSLEDPFVMIMSSYMETTSSNQTTRANEQSEMFRTVQGDNIRFGTKRVFINFVDGAGWLARRSDLRKMYDGCDDIVNLKTLDRLEAIICKYVPEKYFMSARPNVEG